MKMKKTTVSFERRIQVTVFAPEDADHDEICKIAENLAYDGLQGWEPREWEAYVDRISTITIPDDELKVGPPNRYGYRKCLSEAISGGLVVSDDRSDIVDPSDATWWIAKDE